MPPKDHDLDNALYASPDDQYRALKAAALSGIKDQFPFVGEAQRLELNNVWADEQFGPDIEDLDALKEVRIAERTWGVPIYADLSLKDATTGKLKSRARKIKLATLPRPTGHYTYLVNGTEYQPVLQPRLRSGIYARFAPNGTIESSANLKKGFGGQNFAVRLTPETGALMMDVGGRNMPLYPIAKSLGATDSALQNAWGKDVFEANRTDDQVSQRTISRLYERVIRDGEATGEDEHDARVKALQDYFRDTEMDPEVNARTLGRKDAQVSWQTLAEMSRRVLKMSRGEAEGDDRDALWAKEIYGPEDRLLGRLTHPRTKNEIARRVMGNKNIDYANTPREALRDAISNKVTAFFTAGQDFETTELNNPSSIVSGWTKITPVGEGGISSLRGVPASAREMSDTHMGFLDPLHTPESKKIGISLHVSMGTKKKGKALIADTISPRTGKPMPVASSEMLEKVIAFPDQYRPGAGGRPIPVARTVKVMNKGEMDEVSPDKVDAVLRSSHNMFDVTTNLIPFLGNTQGTRGGTASKMSEQALPLVGREAPRVQVSLGSSQDMSVEELLGKKFSIQSPVNGRVTSVKDNRVVIAQQNGTRKNVAMHNYYPLGKKQFLHHTPRVQVGDVVKQGDLIADSNFTRNGTLALGKTLRVAWFPYKGYTLEDASVISESAAKKLTSEHLYNVDVAITDESVLDKKKFKAYHPNVLTKEKDDKLDDKGIIQKGQKVMPGDVLVAHMRKEPTTVDDTILSRLHKSLSGPYKDRAELWDNDTEGVVTDVENLGRKVRVFVKAEEPLRVGDKIAGRYGNKSVVTKILPDGEMPHDQEGNPIDAILDPHTISSRINPSQLMESAAGRAAGRLGTTLKIENFAQGDALETVKGWMQKASLPISGKETLKDPTTGRDIPNIFVGDHYVQKLKHTINTKFSARHHTQGYDINETPRKSEHGAQSLDNLTLYAMLAHGSNRSILREMATDYKASRNPEVWRAIQMGQALPKPKPTFAYTKFLSYLSGLGVNVDSDKTGVTLSPMSDKDVENLSSGVVDRPDLTVRGKDIRPLKGGLFDPNIFGGSGIQGDQWGHIDLSTRMPNPLMERAIRTVGHLSSKDYSDIIAGHKGINRHGDIVAK